jgi:predicted nucleotidyltransferase
MDDRGIESLKVLGGRLMIDEQTLQQAVARIVAVAQPTRVILFGSYGRGDSDEGSDVDLMVIKPHVDNRGEEMIQVYQAVGSIGAGVDVLVYSDAEFERRSQVPGTLLYWARKEGRTLYESPH